MHGNVWQWCADLYDLKGPGRVIRGGAWNNAASFCPAARRGANNPTIGNNYVGFRLARVPVP